MPSARVALVTICTTALLGGLTPAAASSIVVATDRLAYTGSVTRYVSLADAQNATNGSTFTLGGANADRDLAIFIVADRAGYYADFNALLTAWYYTTDQTHGAYSGWGNEDNGNVGFVQLYDDDSSTDTALSGEWSADLATYTLALAGTNAPYANDYSRLWDGGSGAPGGTLLTYDFFMQAAFATPASDPDHDGFFDLQAEPVSVTGLFTGLFFNDVDSNYYTFSFQLNMNNWASQQKGLNGAFVPSYFGSDQVVPEPSSMLLLGTGVAALIARRKARRTPPR